MKVPKHLQRKEIQFGKVNKLMSKASFLNEMLNNLLKKKTLFKSFKNSVDINDNFSLEASSSKGFES